MKKLIYSLCAVMLIAFSSCQNENSVNPRPIDEIVSVVTISGLVKADLNTTNEEYENVPNGTKVVARISTRDLVLNPDYNTEYPYKYYETTTNNGTYSLEVEAGPYGSEVYLYFVDFRADVITSGTPLFCCFL